MSVPIQDRVLYIGPTGNRRLTNLHNVSEVRDFVEASLFVTNQKFFIGDLSSLSTEALTVLLKFLEETENQIACYASSDNIPAVVMSRFRSVVKNRSFEIGDDGFDAFVASLGEDDLPTSRRLLSIAPQSFSSFMLFSCLSPGIRSRVGNLL